MACIVLVALVIQKTPSQVDRQLTHFDMLTKCYYIKTLSM